VNYCGIDIGGLSSYVYLSDAAGRKKWNGAVKTCRVMFETVLKRYVRGGLKVAIEAGNQTAWIHAVLVDLGAEVIVVNPHKVKLIAMSRKKTDKVDANGLGILLRNGTLPEVWIPPAGLRDQRESLRLRMFLVQQRTRLKNRIQGALGRYNIQIAGVSDMFGAEGRLRLGKRLEELPEHTRKSVELELVTLDFLEMQLADIEKRLEELRKVTAEADLLKTLP